MVTYFVTGTSRGIGLGLVQQLAERKDAFVYACARKPEKSKGLKALKGKENVQIITLDTTKIEQIKQAAEVVRNSMQHQHIDVLINNAGAGGKMDADLLSTEGSAYTEVFETNVVGTLNVTHALQPLMKNGQKLIFTISSIMGSIGETTIKEPYAPQYCVSKAALNMYSKMLANQLASDGYVVLSAHPGWVQTEMGGENARITVEESATKLLKLVDNASPNDNGKFKNYEGDELPW